MHLHTAHLQVIRECRAHMIADIENADLLLGHAQGQPRRQFREPVARLVLDLLTWKVGRVLVPVLVTTGPAFCSAVATGFASISENDRPVRYTLYSASKFAKVLIERYMSGYAVIDDLGFPDEELPEFSFSMEDIPEDPAAELRQYLAHMDVTTFGHFQLPEQKPLPFQPESP